MNSIRVTAFVALVLLVASAHADDDNSQADPAPSEDSGEPAMQPTTEHTESPSHGDAAGAAEHTSSVAPPAHGHSSPQHPETPHHTKAHSAATTSLRAAGTGLCIVALSALLLR